MSVYCDILAEADRVWESAWAIDDLRGDTAASDWTAGKVHGLMRAGLADSPAEIARIADALETRLSREQEDMAAQRRVEA